MSDSLLEFAGVSKWYGPVIAVNDVSLGLAPGITGLVGPNGAGKSTLIKLMTGQLRPSLGAGANLWTPRLVGRRQVAHRLLSGCGRFL